MTREQYQTIHVTNLRELAKSRGIKRTSVMKKSELIDAMLALDAEHAAGGTEHAVNPASTDMSGEGADAENGAFRNGRRKQTPVAETTPFSVKSPVPTPRERLRRELRMRLYRYIQTKFPRRRSARRRIRQAAAAEAVRRGGVRQDTNRSGTHRRQNLRARVLCGEREPAGRAARRLQATTNTATHRRGVRGRRARRPAPAAHAASRRHDMRQRSTRPAAV